MNPIDWTDGPGRPVVFGADQPEYAPLPARQIDKTGEVVIRWRLSPAERAAVLGGSDLIQVVTTAGGPIQPQRLEVDDLEQYVETLQSIEAAAAARDNGDDLPIAFRKAAAS